MDLIPGTELNALDMGVERSDVSQFPTFCEAVVAAIGQTLSEGGGVVTIHSGECACGLATRSGPVPHGLESTCDCAPLRFRVEGA